MFNIEFLISFFPYVLPEKASPELSPDSRGYYASETEEPEVSGATFAGGIDIFGFSGVDNDEDFIMVPKLENNNVNKFSDNLTDPQG